MPPQQSHGLLDLIDNRLDFGAHRYTRFKLRGEPSVRSGERQAARAAHWNLEARFRDARGDTFSEKMSFLGENPTGFLHYMPDGRMLAMITRPGRKPPAGNVATPAEAEGLIRSMIAYGSTFECQGDEVLHHCDISWTEKFTGTIQRRKVTFEGNRLTLSPPPSLDPLDGKMSIRRLTWERV